MSSMRSDTEAVASAAPSHEELLERVRRLEARNRELEAALDRPPASSAHDDERIDIRDRTRAEEERRQHETLYRALAENLPHGAAFVVDPDLRYLLAAGQALEEVGLSSVDLEGRILHDVLEPSLAELYEPLYRRALAGEPFEHEHTAHGRSWASRGVPLRHPDGRVYAALAVSYDISQRKRDEETLRKAVQDAEHASKAKSIFLSTMSHELRTPLTAVLGFADLMESEVVGPMNARQKEYLGRIQASSWHLVAIIDEILTFTRSEAGKEDVRVTKVDVAAVARAVAGMLAPEARARGLPLRLHGAHDRALVHTDGGKLRQILTNLVGNALKYTHEGAVDVVLEADEQEVRVHVRDTGPGIPADQVEEIFEPFTQVDGSTTRTTGGTGLGLTICRRLARLLHGDVTVDSTPGRGSTFTLAIPPGRRPLSARGNPLVRPHNQSVLQLTSPLGHLLDRGNAESA